MYLSIIIEFDISYFCVGTTETGYAISDRIGDIKA